MASSSSDVVTIDYTELQMEPSKENPEYQAFLKKLQEAFGTQGLGLVAISNVPGFVQAKQAFLPMAYDLVQLPKEELEALTDATSLYNAGWSFGKEQLGKHQGVDTAKGSFYYNPITDLPGTLQDRKDYPHSYPTNVWPKSSSLPHFEDRAKCLGKLMTDVTILLAKHLDQYLLSELSLYQALLNTEKVKSRLLYYYPPKDDTKNQNNWIGWHNDSGFLTALAGEIYLHHATGEPTTRPPSQSNQQPGLCVANPHNEDIHAIVLPKDCMAVQMGECSQILSGGKFLATPHFVQAPTNENKDLARISLATFVDVPPSFPLSLPSPMTRSDFFQSIPQSKRVPPLQDRWTQNGMPFGQFLYQTFQSYYQWTQ